MSLPLMTETLTSTSISPLLLAACLRDYARRLVLQQSLQAPPADAARAYEDAYGHPLHVETLAEDLLVLASTLDPRKG